MLSDYELQYCDLVTKILSMPRRSTRNHDTLASFAEVLEIDMSDSKYFPLLLGRQMYPNGILAELAAFFKGPKHVDDFKKEGCNYWDLWADEDGALRVDYGNKWRDFNGVDQIAAVLNSLRNDPTGRRHVISAWDPSSQNLSLPCCHFMYQWFVRDGFLDMMWYQRSADLMIGVPSDVVLAAAWNIVFAELVGLKPGKIKMVFGDTHIYANHIDDAKLYLQQADAADRVSGDTGWPVYVRKFNDLDDSLETFCKDSILIMGYSPEDPIKFELNA